MMIYPWFNFAVALGLGLLIGIERERNKGEGSDRQPAGIRTFALAALMGAISIYLGGVALLIAAVGSIALLAAFTYLRQPIGDPGLTTEVAMVSMPLIGGLAMSDVALASALGATVAVTLAMKATVHRFVKSVLTEVEVNDCLAFAIATLVVWPQLPDRYLGPFGALNPHTLWLVVILVLAIGACGHIATRLLGPRSGLPLAGLAAGFVSSTAAIGAMAGHAAREPKTMASAVAGATLSTVATFIQMALLLFAVSRPTLSAMAPALIAGGTVAAVYGIAFTLFALKSEDPKAIDSGGAFSIVTALTLAVTVAAMLVAAAASREMLGEVGVVVGAALAGIVDTHAASISVASLVASEKLTAQEAVIPILAAMSCNAGSKTAMSLSAGSRGFALRIIPGLVLSTVAAWATLFPTLFV
jgi:uncharacterized membrane protein (DUF4010 family)